MPSVKIMNRPVENQSDNENTWQKEVLKYNRPELKKSIWQIFNSVIPYIIFWLLMYKSLEYPYWTTVLLSVAASGFLVRIFIIFHDCGHGSFFRSGKLNVVVGTITGILTFTPYNKWHTEHHQHHATNANLDKRGTGDVWTMTVEEYLRSSWGKRFFYRAFRNPLIMFSLGPLYLILIANRFSRKKMTVKEKFNLYFTNMMLLIIAALISLFIGVKAYLLIQLPIIIIANIMGIWLFYVQHQFDDVIWERSEKWDYKAAAISGSSYLELPAVLQWFTGNIGFHHVHHLSSRIPNYNLPRCHHETELFEGIKPVTISSMLKTFRLNLWDEVSRRMISFKNLKTLQYQNT